MARLPASTELWPGDSDADGVLMNRALGLPASSTFAQRLAEAEHLVAFYKARKKQAKLTEAQALEIRRLYASGRPVTELQRDFKVSHSTVYDILRRRTWGKPLGDE